MGKVEEINELESWVAPSVRDMGGTDGANPLTLRSLRLGRLLLVEAEGRFDLQTVEQLMSALEEPNGVSAVMVDLSGLVAIDGIAAGTLLAEHRRLEAAGKALALLCPPGDVRRVLELHGITDLVAVFAEADAAVDAAAALS